MISARLIVSTLLLAMAATAMAQGKYPTKPIRMVVPFPPGSASDFLARTIGQKLGAAYGQQVVVDNRPGAGGLIGSQIIAKAAADGYTLALIGQAHLLNGLLHRDPGYRVFDDFSPVSLVASMPNVLVVSPSLPVNSVGELISFAKARPGRLNIGSSGVGSAAHLAGEMFKLAAGIDVVHVPFRLFPDVFSEMMAGRVHLYVFLLPAVMPVLQQGKLRPLAVATPKRAPALPDVPTMAEAGLPSFQSDSWFGIVAPARTQATIVRQLNASIADILRQPTIKERFMAQGAEPAFGSPDSFLKLQKDEYTRMQALAKEIGLAPK